jgi:integrase
MSISAKEIAQAKAGETLRDDVVKGLQLRVYPSGKKVFHVYYSLFGAERRPKIGEYPTMQLHEARKIAAEYRATSATGADPAIRSERPVETVETLWVQYYQDRASFKKSAKEDARIWSVYLKHFIGGSLVSEVSYADISRIHSKLSGTPYQANRVLALASTLFAFAVKPLRLISDNPCAGVRRFSEAKRRRYYTPHELRSLCGILDEESEKNPGSVAFLYLLIFTGARKSEIATAKTEWLDGSVLRLPDSKTGEKEIALPEQAINAIKKVAGGEYLVPVADPKKLWDKVRKLAGCPDLRMHDLRHSFASMALASGVPLSQIGELLGHKNVQTTKRYAHLITEVAESAAAKTANAIAYVLTGA